jgi:ribosomal-protein-alanine N-acetyltransferase
MVDYQLLNTTDFVTTLEKEEIINFLLKNLDDYLDSRDNVSRAIEYALSKFPHQGGFVLMAKDGTEIIGVSVVNRTNFEGYFAENILVYMAVDEQQRRNGIAAELLDRTKVYTKGDVVVRVDGNSAVNSLFKKAGFEEGSFELLFKRN